MPKDFFSHSVYFAWAFYLLVVGFTLIATYTDLRTVRIPKWLTLPGLALGVLLNVFLGAWVGPAGEARGPFWLGEHQGGWRGGLDGLLFSLAGFATGFGLFLVMWILKTCGAGDVKFFAALGAWVGPYLAIVLLAGTIVFVIILSFVKLFWKVVTRGFGHTIKNYTMRGAISPKRKRGIEQRGLVEERAPRGRLMAYAPAVALSTVLVLPWFFRAELQLAPADAETSDRTQAWSQ